MTKRRSATSVEHIHELPSPTTTISPQHQSFIDPADILSVIRPSSELWGNESLKGDLQSVVQFVAQHGTVGDGKRQGKASKCVNFGIDIARDEVFGQQHFLDPSTERARHSIGCIIDRLWLCGREIQKEVDKDYLGGNCFRNNHYAARIRSLLQARIAQFESVTVCLTLLLPLLGGCSGHLDKLNDSMYSYCKTLAMNCVLVDDDSGHIYLLQVIGNFRKGTTSATTAYRASKKFDALVRHLNTFKLKLKRNYSFIFNQFSQGDVDHSFFRNPEDLDTMCLHDGMSWELHNIEGEPYEGLQHIKKPMLFLPVGLSRTFSLSMVLDELERLKSVLHIDQLAELAFFASFMGSTTCFAEVLRQLRESGEIYNYEHPIHAVNKKFIELFPTIHCGVHPRFQCSSLKVLQLTHESEKNGEPTPDDDSRLTEISRALFEWVDFIDGFRGKKDASDIPFHTVSAMMDNTTKKVQQASGMEKFDWGGFRLSVFTTYASALGIVKPGKHLHQVIIPTKTMASRHHLTTPLKADSNNSKAKKKHVETCTELDEQCRYLSKSMGFKRYRRDLIEVYLCESKPCRELNIKDIFIKGQRLFLISDDGVAMVKAYGKGNDWVPVDPILSTKKF